jgi:ALG11 mannosyltransferase N-terminus
MADGRLPVIHETEHGITLLMPPIFIDMWNPSLLLSGCSFVTLSFVIGYHRISSFLQRRTKRRNSNCLASTSIAFFHPYCTGGGGGERVLWKMVDVLCHLIDRGLLLNPTIVIYTVDVPSVSYTQGK